MALDRQMSGRDQASALREMVLSSVGGRSKFQGLRSIAVVSGKGGVGKSNLSVNLALAMGQMGVRVMLMDADMGLANADLLLGVVPKHHLGHVIGGQMGLEDILLSVDQGVSLIPGGAGFSDLADLDEQSQAMLIEKFSALEGRAEVLLVDTGAGIHRNVISFAAAADEVLLLTTTEPTAIRDAYGVLKSLVMGLSWKPNVSLVVNMAMSDDEAFSVADRIRLAAGQFLDLNVNYLGYVLWDQRVMDSVRRRRPFVLQSPDSPASSCVKVIARRLLKVDQEDVLGGRGLKAFMLRLGKRMRLKG
jgi:flagellar biosynthesis protein FlhG